MQTVLACARLLPPRVVGGQENLNAEVLAVLRRNFTVLDATHHGGRSTQGFYLAKLPAVVAARSGKADWVDLSDGSLAFAQGFARAPCVLRANGKDMTWANGLHQFLLRRHLPRMAGVVANSHAMARIVQAHGVAPDNVRVVFPCIRQPSGPSPARRDGGDLLLLGRLVPKKGQVEFVQRIWPGLAQRNPDLHLHIVGDGPTAPALQEAIRLSAAPQRITWHGRLPQAELEALFAKARLLLMASRSIPGDFEGFGMVSAEAAMRGLATVGFPTDGVLDAILDGRTGILATEQSDTAYAAAVEEALARSWDPAAMASLAEATWGPARFERQYLAATRAFVEASA